MEGTLRAFVAIQLPPPVIDLAGTLQEELKDCGLKLRWVKPQNLHLTLKFLGDIPETDITNLADAINRTVVDEPPLELILQGMGTFPGIKRPRVLWIGFGGQVDRLQQLHTNLEDQLARVGFVRDKRVLKAHLTIARIKGAVAPGHLLDSIKGVGQFPPHSFAARKIVLYKSDLRPQGAIYTPLAEANLTKLT